MSMFTDFSHQYGQGTNVGVDVSGQGTGIETSVSGHHTVISHMPNGLGGENTYYDGKLVHTNQPNPFGGENVYDHNGHLLRTSIGDTVGTEHHAVTNDDGSVAQHAMAPVDFGNGTQILGYADPLAHSGSYHMPPFDPNQFRK